MLYNLISFIYHPFQLLIKLLAYFIHMKVEINIFVCVITPIWVCEVFVRERVSVRVPVRV